MRGLKAVIALLFVVAGIFLGALNQQLIDIDLFFVVYHAPLGLTLIVCILLGTIVGGALASFSMYLRKNKTTVSANAKQVKQNSQDEPKP